MSLLSGLDLERGTGESPGRVETLPGVYIVRERQEKEKDTDDSGTREQASEGETGSKRG